MSARNDDPAVGVVVAVSQAAPGAAALAPWLERYCAQSQGRVQAQVLPRLSTEASRPEPCAVILRSGAVMATLFGAPSWQDLLPLIEIALGPGSSPRAA